MSHYTVKKIKNGEIINPTFHCQVVDWYILDWSVIFKSMIHLLLLTSVVFQQYTFLSFSYPTSQLFRILMIFKKSHTSAVNSPLRPDKIKLRKKTALKKESLYRDSVKRPYQLM